MEIHLFITKGTIFFASILYIYYFCFLFYLGFSGEYILQWYSPVQSIVNFLPIFFFCQVVFDYTIFIWIIVTFSKQFFPLSFFLFFIFYFFYSDKFYNGCEVSLSITRFLYSLWGHLVCSFFLKKAGLGINSVLPGGFFNIF